MDVDVLFIVSSRESKRSFEYTWLRNNWNENIWDKWKENGNLCEFSFNARNICLQQTVYFFLKYQMRIKKAFTQ